MEGGNKYVDRGIHHDVVRFMVACLSFWWSCRGVSRAAGLDFDINVLNDIS